MVCLGSRDRTLSIEPESGSDVVERCQGAASWCVLDSGEIIVPYHNGDELLLMEFVPEPDV